MNKVAYVGLLVFGIPLVVLIGQNISTDALGVLVGVVVGITASVPTSLLLVALLRRERKAYRADGGNQ